MAASVVDGGRLLRLFVVAFVVVFGLAGCNGGTVDRHALTNDASTLDSIACEGALLAHDVARGRTTSFFAREQAEELRIQSSNLADALCDAKTVPSIEQRVREKARDAAALAATLRAAPRPSVRPGGRRRRSSAARRSMGSCP